MYELKGLMQFAVYALMGISIVWAICAVTLRSLFHSALCFTAVLLGIAGIFVVLHAEFLAAVQVLIYVGAVMTLVIFAVMLTERFTDKTVRQNNAQSWIGLLSGVAFLTLLIKVIVATPWPKHPDAVSATIMTSQNTKSIGIALLSQYVFPFEVLAVVLTAVVIGAVVIAKKDKIA